MSVVELTKQNFAQEVSEGKVLIDFWASWCGPCKMLSPVIDEIAQNPPAGVKVCKVNIDEQPELAEEFQVMSIPTLAVLKNGQKAAVSVGVKAKKAILEMVEKA